MKILPKSLNTDRILSRNNKTKKQRTLSYISLDITGKLISEASNLIVEYSWGQDYPIEPIDDLTTSIQVFGALVDGKLIGTAYVHKSASPDGLDNNNLWLGGLVVHPNYRRKGIAKTLLRKQTRFAENKRGRVLTCSDNEKVCNLLESLNWKLLRITYDEGGNLCRVYEKIRCKII